MRVYVASPVRKFEVLSHPEECDADHISRLQEEMWHIRRYVYKLEYEGHTVYWPYEGVVAKDELQLCARNMSALREADEVHVWWDPYSPDVVFELGGALYGGKPIVIINHEAFADENKLSSLDDPARHLTRMLIKWEETSDFSKKVLENASVAWWLQQAKKEKERKQA